MCHNSAKTSLNTERKTNLNSGIPKEIKFQIEIYYLKVKLLLDGIPLSTETKKRD